MAFAPGFDHDVFVSYAHVDNEPFPEIDGSRWVTNLRRTLQTLLDQSLGGTRQASIWMDETNLPGAGQVTPEIHSRVGKSALLVVVLSEAYLKRSWCLDELATYVQAMGGPKAIDGRVFVIQRDEIGRPSWPGALQDFRGYEFFARDAQTDRVRILAVPKPDPAERVYWSRLRDLQVELAERLKTLSERQKQAPSEPAKPPPPSEPTPPQAVVSAPPPPTGAAARTAVFLAETAPELTTDREDLARFLRSEGRDVFPKTFYDRSPAGFRGAVASDLADAAAFVQIVGERGVPASATETYESIQVAVAREAMTGGRPVVLWTPRAPSAERGGNAAHEALLRDASLTVMAREDFKTHLRRVLVGAGRPPELPDPVTDPVVLVGAALEDRAHTALIARRLQDAGIDYRMVGPDRSLADVARAAPDEIRACILVYGACADPWLEEQIGGLRKLLLERKAAAPVCGLLVAPPDTERTPLAWFRQLLVLRGNADDSWGKFLGRLGVAPA